MKEYIDKSALLSKIEKAIDESAPLHDQQWEEGYYCGLYEAESIIDTLEVKEVDVENSFEGNVCKNCNTYLKEMDKDDITKTLESQERGGDEIIYTSSCEWCNRDSCEDCYDEED